MTQNQFINANQRLRWAARFNHGTQGIDAMRSLNLFGALLAITVIAASCAHADPNPLKVSFLLINQATAKPLINATVSVYDGFDKKLSQFGGPVKPDNKRYHVADITTSAYGTIDLDLSRLKEDTILITSGNLHKYIRHKDNVVTVFHYIRKANALQVAAHYHYDLKTKLVSITRFPEEKTDQAKAFSVIEAPMD